MNTFSVEPRKRRRPFRRLRSLAGELMHNREVYSEPQAHGFAERAERIARNWYQRDQGSLPLPEKAIPAAPEWPTDDVMRAALSAFWSAYGDARNNGARMSGKTAAGVRAALLAAVEQQAPVWLGVDLAAPGHDRTVEVRRAPVAVKSPSAPCDTSRRPLQDTAQQALHLQHFVDGLGWVVRCSDAPAFAAALVTTARIAVSP